MTVDPAVLRALTPTGKLRASINLGNPILAGSNAETGAPEGISVDLARELAARLGVEVDLVVFGAAGKSFEAVSSEQADVGFFAIDPDRAAHIAFTAPYVLIEGFYLVREDSPIRSNAEVDAAQNRVAVGQGSAYDLYLSRELRHARIVRAPTSPSVVRMFIEQHLEVAAGVKQQLEADARVTPGLRLLDERFMVIQQAMATPTSRGYVAANYLRDFVEEMKASGFVDVSMSRHGIAGARVATAA